MNTQKKQDQKDQRQKTRHTQEPKKRGRSQNQESMKLQEHELPELRMTR
jgi:hypothetical protein